MDMRMCWQTAVAMDIDDIACYDRVYTLSICLKWSFRVSIRVTGI